MWIVNSVFCVACVVYFVMLAVLWACITLNVVTNSTVRLMMIRRRGWYSARHTDISMWVPGSLSLTQLTLISWNCFSRWVRIVKCIIWYFIIHTLMLTLLTILHICVLGSVSCCGNAWNISVGRKVKVCFLLSYFYRFVSSHHCLLVA